MMSDEYTEDDAPQSLFVGMAVGIPWGIVLWVVIIRLIQAAI